MWSFLSNLFRKKEGKGVHSIFDVAGYILKKQGPVTAMKLQKLCYYSQAWSLVWDDKPLFHEDFEAWTNGPVCRKLFAIHRGEYIVNEISVKYAGIESFSSEEIQTIDAVLNHYGDKDPQWLSTLTHLEKPWNQARSGYAEGENCTEVITKKSMKEYYASI